MGKILRLKREDGQRGQAMIEFALILPLLLIITFIIVDFGFGFSQWVIVTNASREGARYGATGVPEADVVTRTVETSNGVLSDGNVEVTYVDVNGNAAADRGDHVVVKVTHDYNFLTPLAVFLQLPGLTPITLSACSDMRLEVPVTSAIVGGSGC